MKKFTRIILFLMFFPIITNCFDDDAEQIIVTPETVTLALGESQQFTSSKSYITWEISGNTGSSKIDKDGLFTVGLDETADKITVHAKYDSSYYKDGKAAVTIAAAGITPQGLKVTKPSSGSIALSWNPMSGVTSFSVWRSTNGKDFGQIAASATGTSYTDNAVSAGASYFYRIQANGVNSQVVFSFASNYFNMPTFAQRKLLPIKPSQKQYFRFPVNHGQQYSIAWSNGNNGNLTGDVRVSAWHNNGTEIFKDATNGYTDAKVFTAAASGFVTVEASNRHSSNNYDYEIYCYGTNGEADAGTVALPPYKVSAFWVIGSGSNEISLSWDTVSDAVRYNLYRSNAQNGAYSPIGNSDSTTITDSPVSPGSYNWYRIAAVNANGLEGCQYQGAFGVAASHMQLGRYDQYQLFTISPGAKVYYRMSVTQGQQYTITWQNGNNANLSGDVRVTAWQNNGTNIFYDAVYGYGQYARGFIATFSGSVTIELYNRHSSNSYDYQIYY